MGLVAGSSTLNVLLPPVMPSNTAWEYSKLPVQVALWPTRRMESDANVLAAASCTAAGMSAVQASVPKLGEDTSGSLASHLMLPVFSRVTLNCTCSFTAVMAAAEPMRTKDQVTFLIGSSVTACAAVGATDTVVLPLGSVAEALTVICMLLASNSTTVAVRVRSHVLLPPAARVLSAEAQSMTASVLLSCTVLSATVPAFCTVTAPVHVTVPPAGRRGKGACQVSVL